ncbi:MAG: glucosidase [Myxococcales bacterium]|nr:glucosidase [Myxococcales bacterium]
MQARLQPPKPGVPLPTAEHDAAARVARELDRLDLAAKRKLHWRRWGPYVSERQWGTVREDYSATGDAWNYFPFDHSHLRTYRWGEDGIGGICDNRQRLCWALALWNGKDPILKERMFGLAGPEGNHGEDPKELYWYTDALPSHSYGKMVYKYPVARYPYEDLRHKNRRRSKAEPEYELQDTGVLEHGYFDTVIEHAKADVDDVLLRVTVTNRSPSAQTLHLLPTVWFRNTWSWDHDAPKPSIERAAGGPDHGALHLRHQSLGERFYYAQNHGQWLVTENESNGERLGWWPQRTPRGHYKDAFADAVIAGDAGAAQAVTGTKAASWHTLTLAAGETAVVRLRLTNKASSAPFADFEAVYAERLLDLEAFYAAVGSPAMTPDETRVYRQALAGLLFTKQYYGFDLRRWFEGDPAQPKPPAARLLGRNAHWQHLHHDDVLTMPDKWEYPWYAAWDSAFHCVAFALIDPDYAKRQLRLLLREWYMHPNGQIPAYEWNFGDVNPPVHAWAAWRVYKIDQRATGKGDLNFLEKIFHKLLINFTWWVNRKDTEGNNVFEGGFLGLDNIGVFDRSAPLPNGGKIEQSDATSWMAMYSLNLLAIAMELASNNQNYEDVASKFFEHFMYIANAMHTTHLWDPADGFFYDVLTLPGHQKMPMRVRSMVGLIPLFAVETISEEVLAKLPRFRTRLQWFLENRPDLHETVTQIAQVSPQGRRLLSVLDEPRLRRIVQVMLDETEFLSPYGVRSLSRAHLDQPYSLVLDGSRHEVRYDPAESSTGMFGGNSNWRGPVWFPVNFLVIEALQRFDYFYGERIQVEMPTGSGHMVTLGQAAAELGRRLELLFVRDDTGRRACNGGDDRFDFDPHFKDLVFFHEYFHGDTGAGLGAMHQTGWTALVAKLLKQTQH